MSSLNNNKQQQESLQQNLGYNAKSTISQTAPTSGYGATGTIKSTATDRNGSSTPDAPPHKRAWSLHEASSLLGDHTIGNGASSSPSSSFPKLQQANKGDDTTTRSKFTVSFVVKIIVYALVNVIISVPGLYGYAAVIFNHPVFTPHVSSRYHSAWPTASSF
jgi:hypothetical protein